MAEKSVANAAETDKNFLIILLVVDDLLSKRHRIPRKPF
jgi:hypothetical protein